MIGTRAPWRAIAYLASYLVAGPLLFAFLVGVLLIAAIANITWLGLPISIGAAMVVRGCAAVERNRAALAGPAISGDYRPPAGGVFTRARVLWTDPAMARDCAYLLALFPILLVLDAGALLLGCVTIGLLTIPAWFWLMPQTWPNGETGHGLMIGSFPDGPEAGGWGLWIGDLPTALIVAVGALIAGALAVAPVLIGAARLHIRFADRLLGPAVDPLAEAKAILAGPGPLPS
ncbi:sensor domain-containing protein [Dactylosporangium sp. NPDC051485]|uniref:sensor domain-containing protein n=1 Tax=Dactylosporangium sp. NPDC051485 TaxID=3154846 RepID=UPI00343F707F